MTAILRKAGIEDRQVSAIADKLGAEIRPGVDAYLFTYKNDLWLLDLKAGISRELTHTPDQAEDEAVIFREQLLQVFTAIGLTLFGHGSRAAEVLVNLVVEIIAVGDNKKCPVARHLSQNLLGEKHHRKRFAASLREPEHAEGVMLGI